MNQNNEQVYTVGAFAQMTSVTERTLRYYDRKGLLKPSAYNSQGHRLYTRKDLFRLQKILTYKFLGFSLEEIEKHMQNQEEPFQRTLAAQAKMLKQKQAQLEKIISSVDRLLRLIPEEEDFSSDLMLALIHAIQYEDEQKRWLAERVPAPFIDQLFMEGNPEERLEVEKRMTALLGDLIRFYKEGRSPKDPDALSRGEEIASILYTMFDAESLHQLAENPLFSEENVPEDALDPFLFPGTIFSLEEETYLQEVFQQVMDKEERVKKGGDEDGT